MTTPSDPLALLRSKSYLALLVLAAIIGVPVSAAAYLFLALVSKLQMWIFTDLPKDVGFHSEPLWWPIPPLLLAGLLVALTIWYLPGVFGHVAEGRGPVPEDQAIDWLYGVRGHDPARSAGSARNAAGSSPTASTSATREAKCARC